MFALTLVLGLVAGSACGQGVPVKICPAGKTQTKTYMHQFVESPDGTQYAFRYFPGDDQPKGRTGAAGPCEVWTCTSDLARHRKAFTSPKGEGGHGSDVIVWVSNDLIYYAGIAYQPSTRRILWQFTGSGGELPLARGRPVGKTKLYVAVRRHAKRKGFYWLNPSAPRKPDLHLVNDMKNLAPYYKGSWEHAEATYIYRNPGDTKLFVVVYDRSRRREYAFVLNADGAVHSYLGHNRRGYCANGHVLPDEEHPDPGTGYVGDDGRIHYFVGSWNAWVVENLQYRALRPLCLTYLLTGDERYAQKAAFILDALAQIYPECDAGSWDYPSNPPSGRFCRPWYQVARVLIHYVDFYDEIFNSPALDEPSLVEGMTRRANIEENLLRNGAWYCYEQSLKGGLHNGEADYVRGALAVGCVLGIDDYVDWALDGPYGIRSIIANNADRDGRYFETSIGYALHARDLYLTFTEPMRNYRSDAWPQGIDLYADPKFLTFYFLPAALFDCAGHSPRYGDSGPDVSLARPTDPVFSSTDYEFAEVCYARTSGELRTPFADALTYLAGNRGEELRSSARDRQWMLYHAGEFPERSDPAATRARITSTDFFGQKGIAILRAGDGDESQAALLRYGPSLNHGHYDDLNLNYYALGHELTYDLGYGLGSTHTQVGWSKQTTSHNLVVVDETRQMAGAGGRMNV